MITVAVLALALLAVALVLVFSVRARNPAGRPREDVVAHGPTEPAASVAPEVHPPVSDDAVGLGGLYRSVFQSIADALVVIDERGLVQSFSPSAERTFGFKASEVIGRSVSVLMPAPDREQHDQYVRKYVDGWASGRMETLLLTGDAHIIRPEREIVATRKDGSTFPARLIVSEVETGGRRLFVGLITDVSERKRLEAELAARIDEQSSLLQKLREAYDVIERQKERMQGELDVGREIQMSMVPHRFPRMQDVDLWATLRPAREVGGDFYDCFTAPDQRLWVCVGDVSGKGVPAALLMAVTKTLVKASAARGRCPSAVLTEVNDELSRENESAMFVTVFVASLDVATGELRYANAGHNPPLLRRVASGVERLAARHGPVLGALEDVTYSESTMTLLPDDVLLLYTDGVTEAWNESEQLFSEGKLRDAIEAGAGLGAEQVVARVVSAVESFAGGAEQSDDITVLVLRFRPTASTTPGERHSFSVGNSLDALPGALDEVDRIVALCGGDDVTRRRIGVAFDELLSNIIRHGRPSWGRDTIECEISSQDGAIVAAIRDNGPPFDPLGLPEPDTRLPLEEREIGGLGVHIVRSMFEDVRYERVGTGNLVTIRVVPREPRDTAEAGHLR